MKFAAKLAILFSGIFLILGVIVSYFIYTSNIKSLEEQITDKLEEQAFHAMDKLDRMLFEKSANIKMLTTDPVIMSRDSTPKQITEKLKTFEKNYKVFVYMSLFDLNRLRIADTSGKNIGKQHPFTEYWQEIAEGNDFVMDAYMSGALQEAVIYFAAVVKDEKGFPFRVIVSRMSIENLYGIIKHAVGIHEFEIEKTLKVNLVNKNGILLYSNYNKKGIFKEIAPDWEITKKFIATEGKIGSQKHYHSEGGEIYTFVREHGYLDFKGNDWTLISHLPTKVIFQPAVELRNRMIIILLVIGAFAFPVVYLFSRKVSEPITKLQNAAVEIGRGNLDVKVEISSKDEIGQLSAFFNKMALDLKKHIQQNDLILKSAGEGILGLDLDGKHTFVNPAAAKMLGYKVRELLGKHSHSIWHHTKEDGSPYPEEECPIYDAFRKGSVNQRVRDEVFWRKDGTSFPVAYTSTPIIEDDRIVGAVVTFTDITERKNLEQQFRQAQKMEAVGRLTGGIAHDFNNTLQIIMSIGGLLQLKIKEDDPLREYINDLFAVTSRAANLTKSLLAFSRKQILNPMPVNLNDIIKNAEKLLSRIIGEDIELKTELSDKDLIVIADSGQIEQVLMNLATNSWDAMPEGGELIIETGIMEMDEEFVKTHGYGKTGEYALMAVTDTGLGMDEGTKEKIFEPFFTTKEVGKGTGLGLSTVYGIIKQHDGYINVYSEVGRGTTFRIYLPLIKREVLNK
ncbi:MAG: hypothetical protein C0415_04725 [Thermodesulfovibrio sp.]|nr:hypothetical protein [Thermodesulfovibrio sp.]